MLKRPETTQLIDVPNEGLIALLGKRITLFCVNYIYTGTLAGVNEKFVQLTDPAIVYETGPYTTKEWKDSQKLPNDFYIMLAAVEGFGVVK